MTDKRPSPDILQLVDGLLKKTEAGKVEWKATADRRAFVASIAGDTTFRIRMVEGTDINDFGQPESFAEPRLDMLDSKGNLLWDITTNDVRGPLLRKLYTAARYIGNKLDERVASALDDLNKL